MQYFLGKRSKKTARLNPKSRDIKSVHKQQLTKYTTLSLRYIILEYHTISHSSSLTQVF